MSERRDYTGKEFGKWTVLSFDRVKANRNSYWLCKCECGTIRSVQIARLVSDGGKGGCGCARRHGHGRSGHHSPTYTSWASMLTRCTNSDRAEWPHYGGRGIKVCERWASFKNFLADMGERPSKKHTLERVDNDGDYKPGNCIWATRKAQARNQRSNRRLTHNGETRSVIEWAEATGIKYRTLLGRLSHGWPVERALTTV